MQLQSFPGGLCYARDEQGRIMLLYEALQREDGVRVLNFPSLLMLDYDTPSLRHHSPSSVIGTSLEDFKKRLLDSDEVFAKYGYPIEATWRIHRTAGGYHAFRMDTAIPPSHRAAAAIYEIGCDPGYAMLVRNTRTWPIRLTRKTKTETVIYTVVEEMFGGTEVCKECKLQINLYGALVRLHNAESSQADS